MQRRAKCFFQCPLKILCKSACIFPHCPSTCRRARSSQPAPRPRCGGRGRAGAPAVPSGTARPGPGEAGLLEPLWPAAAAGSSCQLWSMSETRAGSVPGTAQSATICWVLELSRRMRVSKWPAFAAGKGFLWVLRMWQCKRKKYPWARPAQPWQTSASSWLSGQI